MVQIWRDVPAAVSEGAVPAWMEEQTETSHAREPLAISRKFKRKMILDFSENTSCNSWSCCDRKNAYAPTSSGIQHLGDTGIEGLLARALDSPLPPSVREWKDFRHDFASYMIEISHFVPYRYAHCPSWNGCKQHDYVKEVRRLALWNTGLPAFQTMAIPNVEKEGLGREWTCLLPSKSYTCALHGLRFHINLLWRRPVIDTIFCCPRSKLGMGVQSSYDCKLLLQFGITQFQRPTLPVGIFEARVGYEITKTKVHSHQINEAPKTRYFYSYGRELGLCELDPRNVGITEAFRQAVLKEVFGFRCRGHCHVYIIKNYKVHRISKSKQDARLAEIVKNQGPHEDAEDAHHQDTVSRNVEIEDEVESESSKESDEESKSPTEVISPNPFANIDPSVVDPWSLNPSSGELDNDNDEGNVNGVNNDSRRRRISDRELSPVLNCILALYESLKVRDGTQSMPS